MSSKSGPPGTSARAARATGQHAQVREAREASLVARERATGEHDLAITEREVQVLLREESLRLRGEADDARRDREQLVVQLRAANEKLVLATLHADAMAEAAEAAREIADRSAAAEAEGRRRAEALTAELRASERALRASEHQLRTMADTLPMLAWYARPDGEIGWFNQRWYDYTGSAPGDLDSLRRQAMLDPAAGPRLEAAWRAATLSGEPFEATFRLRRHDGALRWFLSRALPLRGADGQVVQWFGVTVDIDDQKRAQAVADASLRAKDELVAILVHELRAPLAPIVAALDLMTETDPAAFPLERAILGRQVANLVRLVDDLLDVSRINEGKVELDRAPIELAVVVARAVEMASPLLHKKGHELRVEVAPTGLAIDGDATRLVQIVGNLLTNAAKYTPAHGTISVTGELRRGNVRLRVRDTGIGISAAMLPHVFELFAQERQPGRHAEGGLGLGLAIVQKLVALHGGTVIARSDGLGHGSELVVDLPRHTGPERTAHARA